jgi:pimeloyl-ACP methyl ester carboxylesterase
MKIKVPSDVTAEEKRSTRVLTQLCAFAALVACLGGCAVDNRQSEDMVTSDLFIPHTSTLPALAGQKVGLFVRHKAAASIARGEGDMRGRVVLFVHGGTVPGVPAYDLDYGTYDWMAFLARAGFNVYAMDVSGYGSSPRPMMDDPCNVNPKQQSLLKGRPLKTACAPNYPYEFNTIRDDWAEMDTVVDYLRKSNGVERIHIIGWSAGGPRVGGYAAQHPAKIDRVMLYAPSPTVAGPIPDRPSGGFPVGLQTREDFEQKRWDPDVRCPGQVEPGVRDVLWKSIMEWDRVGASWHSSEGVMRARTATAFGWTPDLATRLVAPTLVVVGEFDRLSDRRTVYEQIGAREKVFVNVSCASHFMLWEKQHRALHYAALEWFRRGGVQGISRGEVRVDRDGRFFRP